jgi:hypothetical protein
MQLITVAAINRGNPIITADRGNPKAASHANHNQRVLNEPGEYEGADVQWTVGP